MEEKSSESKKEFLAGSLGVSVYQISEEEAEFIEQAWLYLTEFSPDYMV
ncbi:hypothetical protein HA075_25120 [bacterium BFN5]|nr:hypothetical protein HA075_25120 [bacterium BFN5]